MPSVREQIAQDLADVCVFGDLTQSFDTLLQKVEESGRSFWRISFSRKLLEGVIRVNSPTSIVIKWRTTDPTLQKYGVENCKSGREAKSILHKFIER